MQQTIQPPKRSYAWFVLLMMVLLYLVNVADRYVASGLLEDIKKTFDVSDTYMGFVIGPMFAFTYTLLAIPIARFADRHNRVRIICAGAVLWSIFTILSGLAQNPTSFALARLGVGIGEAAFIAPAFSLLSDYFPPKKRALAFAILNFGVYFGQIFGLVGGAEIAEASNWRNAFLVLGAPGIVLAVITFFAVKEPVRGRLDEGGARVKSVAPTHTFFQTLAILWSARSFRFMTMGTALGGYASYGFGIWAPTLFARAFDLSLADANKSYGGPSFIAGITGALLLGVVCDRLASRDARWPFRLCAIGLIGFFTTMIILCFVTDIRIAIALTFPAGLMAGGWVIAMQSALQDLLPAKARATGTAIWGFALTFAGLVLGVQLVGVINDTLAGQFGDQAIRYAMALTLMAALPAVICILMAGRTVQADRQYLLNALDAENRWD